MIMGRKTREELESSGAHENETEETLATLKQIAATMAATSERLNDVIDRLAVKED